MQELKDLRNYKTIENVIETSIQLGLNKKSIYKLNPVGLVKHCPIDEDNSLGVEEMALNDEYFKFKMTKLHYLGKPSTALYMKSATRQIKMRIKTMKLQEQKQQSLQAQSYQSTISHELRTPILSVILLLQQIIAILTAASAPSAEKLAQACKNAKMMHGQLSMMQSFIEDLLNLQLVSQGIFTIANEKFKPREAIEFVLEMFSLKIKDSRVNLTVEFWDHLRNPNRSDSQDIGRLNQSG